MPNGKMTGKLADRGKALRFSVPTTLYRPETSIKQSAPGVSFVTLPSGNRVMDVTAMNAATDDNGRSLNVRLDKFLHGMGRTDPKNLVSIIGLTANNWPDRFINLCNVLAKFGPKGWVMEYMLLVHAAAPHELFSVPAALEEIDTAFLNEVS